jgi:hypothetical protein
VGGKLVGRIFIPVDTSEAVKECINIPSTKKIDQTLAP